MASKSGSGSSKAPTGARIGSLRQDFKKAASGQKAPKQPKAQHNLKPPTNARGAGPTMGGAAPSAAPPRQQGSAIGKTAAKVVKPTPTKQFTNAAAKPKSQSAKASAAVKPVSGNSAKRSFAKAAVGSPSQSFNRAAKIKRGR